jgi:gliding motility-associated-like protein
MKLRFLFIFLFISSFCFAQKEANIWYFGNNAGLDFNSGSPIALLDGALSTGEGCASISDGDGNLLFYTDGRQVYNRDHVLMLNGDGLGGDTSSTHSAIIVPKPGDPNIYYVFTVDANGGSNGLQYSEVDMQLDGGLGGITMLKNFQLENPVTEKITAVRNSINNSYWVVSHRWDEDDDPTTFLPTNEFIAFRVSNSGVDPNPVVSNAGTRIGGESGNTIGQIKISPNGRKLATATYGNDAEFQLFDFNAATGRVSNAVSLLSGAATGGGPGTSVGPYGIEFSPNSEVLYGSVFLGHIYQWDLSSNIPQNIIDSRRQLSGRTRSFGALQLATDGRIYIANSNVFLDVIRNPNQIGVLSSYAPDFVSLDGRRANLGLPPFVQSFFLISIQVDNVCFGDVTQFSINDTVDSVLWNFGDPASGANNTSTEFSPTHVFTAPGTYQVSLEATANGETNFFDEIVTIYERPTIAAAPEDISICDLDGDGFETFDFSDESALIFGSQDPAVFEVQYSLEANFANLIPDPTNYTNTNPSETIYYRIINSQNIGCGAQGSFTLLVSTSIDLPATVNNYELCDDDTDGDDTNGFVDSFLLSTKDAEILANVDSTDYEVNYFLTQADAIANINAIDKTVPYQNQTVNSQTIYVRVNDVGNGSCVDTSLQFDLVVNPLPTVNPLIELRQCDTDTDGFSLFNLNEAAAEISTNFANETFDFYPTLGDAVNGTNLIPNPTTYQNQTVTTDRVWARTITSAGCFRISEVVLIVSTSGIPATFQRSFTECDDFLDSNGDDNENNDNRDGIATFDFSSVTADVEALFPPTQQLIITYYRNEADALAEENPIADPSNYRNIGYPNSQQVYIRVDSELDNDCFGLDPFITLNVNPVPEAAEVPNIELCDDLNDGDGFNGIVQSFDLDAQTSDILGTQDPNNFTVTYHTSLADSESGANPIINTAAYTNIVPNQQTIYVRVLNETNGCFSNQTSFDLIVNPLPIANPVPDLEVCDDDSDGSAQNGFAQSFDLESQTEAVLGGQDPTQFSVTYHASLSDAELGILPLLTPFSNSIPDRQTIYVRVFNSATQCANGITSFDVIVNPEPTTEEVSNLSFCDDDADGDDTNGFIQNIILDDPEFIRDILGDNQSVDDYTVTFHESQQNATDGVAALQSPYQNRDPFQQTIFVRVENNATGCVNDDFTFEVIVNPLPEFDVTTPQIVCLNLVPLTIGIENPSTVYDYTWTTPNGDNFFGEQLDVFVGGTYLVTATTTDGTDCSRTKEIVVNESNIAQITENDVTIVDDSENNSITIDPSNLGIGDYEFALEDDDGNSVASFQDAPVFENLEGGVYTILVRDKNGCGTTSLVVPVIEFPKFFTPNNDNFNDTWTIKGANSTFFPTSEIYIFNRYGKQVATLEIDGPGWDGTFNGRILPSDDYWFSVMIVDTNGTIRERKGNFSLLRK